MQLRSVFSAVLLLSLAACSSEPKAPKYQPPSEHGLGWRVLHPFAKSEKPTPATSAPVANSAAAAAFTPAPRHGVFWHVIHPFGLFGGGQSKGKKYSGVQVTVEPETLAPSLGSTRQLGVRVLVTNYTSTMVALTFPSAQRIEITGRSIDGKIFYTYSTDRNFAQEISVLTINPGEHLEYNEAVPTRSMTVGNAYLITASVIGQPGLQGSATITPVP